MRMAAFALCIIAVSGLPGAVEAAGTHSQGTLVTHRLVDFTIVDTAGHEVYKKIEWTPDADFPVPPVDSWITFPNGRAKVSSVTLHYNISDAADVSVLIEILATRTDAQ